MDPRPVDINKRKSMNHSKNCLRHLYNNILFGLTSASDFSFEYYIYSKLIHTGSVTRVHPYKFTKTRCNIKVHTVSMCVPTIDPRNSLSATQCER